MSLLWWARKRPMKVRIGNDMSKTDLMDEVEAIVTKLLPGGAAIVQFENGHTATCHCTGKMRIAHVRLIVGDKVLAQLSPYDLTKGRITWRIR